MRLLRAKAARKTLAFYRVAFGMEAPYTVLVDGTFVHHAVATVKTNLPGRLEKLLGHGVKYAVPAAVLDDIREERFTADYARDVYGVVISGTPPAIDADATKMLRRKMADEPQDTARPAYLRYFHDSLGITEFRLIGPREMEV